MADNVVTFTNSEMLASVESLAAWLQPFLAKVELSGKNAQ